MASRSILKARIRAVVAAASLVLLVGVEALHGALGASVTGRHIEREHGDRCAIVHNEALCPLGAVGLLALPPRTDSTRQLVSIPAPAPATAPVTVHRTPHIGLHRGRAPPTS